MSGGDFWTLVVVAAIAWAAWKLLLGRSAASSATASEEPTVSASPDSEDRQVKHMRDALSFVKAKQTTLSSEKRSREAWEIKHGLSQVEDLDHLTGTEFESYLGGIYKKQGYEVQFTPTVGDYGADLIIAGKGRRIAVQAKRYAGTVGISAVQEALSGMAYYSCNEAQVVTTGTFTPSAISLAKRSKVTLIDRSELAKLIYSINGDSRVG